MFTYINSGLYWARPVSTIPKIRKCLPVSRKHCQAQHGDRAYDANTILGPTAEKYKKIWGAGCQISKHDPWTPWKITTTWGCRATDSNLGPSPPSWRKKQKIRGDVDESPPHMTQKLVCKWCWCVNECGDTKTIKHALAPPHIWRKRCKTRFRPHATYYNQHLF